MKHFLVSSFENSFQLEINAGFGLKLIHYRVIHYPLRFRLYSSTPLFSLCECIISGDRQAVNFSSDACHIASGILKIEKPNRVSVWRRSEAKLPK